MPAYENFNLRGLAAVIAAYLGFFLMTTEAGVPAPHSPGFLTAVTLGYGLGLGVVLGGLWMIALRAEGHRHQPDERETALEGRAERGGYRALDAALFGLVALVLLDAGYGVLGGYRLDRPETVVFALVTVSALGGVGRFLAGWWAARRS